ncbi:MAG: response regulator [Bacteroidia bacterium]|nr:response regulator [Bacteroidia bacterium]
MNYKLKCVMLIDDNEADNRYHELILQENNATEKIRVAENGHEALELLNECEAPELILLDINMPRMNGWEFMETYRNQGHPSRSKTIVILLSTSSNPEDSKKASEIEGVSEFHVKPLTRAMLSGIFERYF